MGFVRRVFPEMKSQKQSNLNISKPLQQQSSVYSSTESLPQSSTKIGSTQLTFDFHRLNVLLLRGIAKDGFVIGKKICTATMSEAKIQAVVGNLFLLFIYRILINQHLFLENSVIIEGSLGGLQVVDLTPEGHTHQRIISVGRDPLLDNPHPLYIIPTNVHDDENKAFSFKIIRYLENGVETKKQIENSKGSR